MHPDRSETIEALFHAARELEPERRAAYLEEACREDPSLMEEVFALLALHEEATDFLEQPAWELVFPQPRAHPANRLRDLVKKANWPCSNNKRRTWPSKCSRHRTE